MMSFAELSDRIESLKYSATQNYNPQTLEPTNDITRNRVESLKRNAPELFEVGKSILDIGSNKGFISFLLSERYENVTGFEPDEVYCNLSRDVATERGCANVDFYCGGMADIPFKQKYDVVFIGNVHHYFIERGFEAGYPWLWVQKIKSLANNYVVIDGPIEINDGAVQLIAERQQWQEKMRQEYTFNFLCTMFAPQFEPAKLNVNEGGVRHTVVFRRIDSDLPYLNTSNEDFLKLLNNKECEPIDCNGRRAPYSVIKVADHRYKFDPNTNPTGVYMVCNALPHLFPRTLYLIKNKGIIGDVAEWVYGSKPEKYEDVFRALLKINTAVSTVGLSDLQITMTDYARHDNNLLSLDIDMMNTSFDEFYVKNWKRVLKKLLREEMGEGDKYLFFEKLVKTIAPCNSEIFIQLSKKLEGYYEQMPSGRD